MFKKETILSFFSFLLLIALFLFYNSNHKPQIFNTDSSNANSALFNLKNINFEKNKLNGLVGEVEFYWNQLLTPENFYDSIHAPCPEYIKIPGTWNNFRNESDKNKGFGYATYRFKIALPEDDIYGFKIKEFESAYAIWIDGKLVGKVGEVGKTKDEMTPSWKRLLTYYQSQQKETEVIIQVSNFHHRKGGAESLIIFGKAKHLIHYKNALSGLELFLLGVLFIISIYHMVLFLYRNNDKTFLIFSTLCVLISMRLLTTGEELMSEIFPNINWYISLKIEYLSFILAMPALLYYSYLFYKDEVSLIFVKIFFTIAIIFSLFVIVSPSELFTYIPIAYQWLIAIAAIYLLFVSIIAFIKKKENSLFYLGGYLLFFVIIINDILFFNKLLSTSYLMPFGAFILAIVQSIILSKNVSLAFIRMEDLSKKLDSYNKELENKVKERTHQISLQKNEIELQANTLKEVNTQLIELGAFKESLTEMIIHDLKNPLNIVLNFAKDERVIYAGNQMLNLVYNLLDVQRYENSTMRLNLERVSIQELIGQAIYQLNFLVQEKDIQLAIHQNHDYFIQADKDILTRVIVNLLSNALKFTPSKGNVIISIEEKTDTIIFCIEDSGPGIPKNQNEIIFQKFGQFISRKLGRIGSTGLGLTFCKIAIEAHSGSIGYTSTLGKGTTFCCTLPLEKANTNSLLPPIVRLNEIENLHLSKKEKEIIAVIIDELKNVELFEISRIKKLISKIDHHESKNLRRWIKELQQSVWKSDLEKFTILIKIATK